MKELDVVKNLTEADITHCCKSGSFESETLLPPGSKGTIVDVKADDAFLVEFSGNTAYDSCLCYFNRSDLELVWEAPAHKMATPRIVAEYTDADYNNVSIVWVGLGKYQVWINKRCAEELSHDGVIKYLTEKLNMTMVP